MWLFKSPSYHVVGMADREEKWYSVGNCYVNISPGDFRGSKEMR